MTAPAHADDLRYLRRALRLARRGAGLTSPNPAVGAVLVKDGRIIGQGWHRRAGAPHAEIEALRAAERRGHSPQGATLYVTLEPCSTQGRTPPCTEALLAAGIRRVVAAATDPNPLHSGRGFEILRLAGVRVEHGLLAPEAERLNEPFNHWIVHRAPWVTIKAAMTLDGKIATAAGESRWITGPAARAETMRLRLTADAILVGVNTVLADDPELTVRSPERMDAPPPDNRRRPALLKPIRRLILDTRARTPPHARILADPTGGPVTIFVGADAPTRRVQLLARRAQVVRVPRRGERLDLRWILHRLGQEAVTHLLVEGGGEVHAAFLLAGLAHRVVFFYAPKILGGRSAVRAVAGDGARGWDDLVPLEEPTWCRVGEDLCLVARVAGASSTRHFPPRQPRTSAQISPVAGRSCEPERPGRRPASAEPDVEPFPDGPGTLR